jgi:hypothetical protein
MFGNTAYIYVGSAARIAFTLGLHAQEDMKSPHDFKEQLNIRLFCSLYLLDIDTALCYGTPVAIDEDIVAGMPRFPLEQVSDFRRKELGAILNS